MAASTVMPDETVDGLLRDRIQVIQAARGYRVSEDALILAWFARPKRGEFVLDAGTGCGVIAFALAVGQPGIQVVGLEIQAGLSYRAARGVKLNGLQNQVQIVRGDLREAVSFFRPRSFDLVVSNPPYHGPSSGKVSRNRERALARHQIMMPLSELFRVASSLLRKRGRLVFIYPSDRWETIVSRARHAGFRLARMLWIQPRDGAAPRHVCVESLLTGEPVEPVEESLVLYSEQGARTPRAQAILEGRA